MDKKKLSILIPMYNEKDNVIPMADTLTEIMKPLSEKYDYEIIFRDNDSNDGSFEKIRDYSEKDKRIKVIRNSRNYGINSLKNTFSGRITGEVVITIPCDFQEPPELITEFIYWWEQGYQVVAGQKIGSEEGKVKYGLRQIYYRIIGNLSDMPQVKNMSGITLMSTKLYEMHKQNNIYEPMRFFLTDVGCDIKLIKYKQKARKSGKSSYNLWRYLSFSINSLVSTSTAPLRLATVLGVVLSFVSFLVGVFYLILKLIFWNKFSAGMAPILIGMFFIGSVQLLFIGILGEYIADILKKVTPRNPPIVKDLINFDNADSDPYYIKSPSNEEEE